MAQCECGCGKESAGGQFMPGHDQTLRISLEERVGGILALRQLVTAAASYATGKSTAEQFTACVRQVFVRRRPEEGP